MPFENLKKQLEANGFTVSVFASGEDAASYLNREIDGKTVGMGGSMTITGLGLKESLGSHNTLYSHGFTPGDPAEVQKLAADAEIYLLSANAIGGYRRDSQHRRYRQPGGLLPLRPQKGLLCGRKEQGLPGFPQCPPPPAQRGRPEKRPAAGPQDALCRQGRQVLQL